MHEHTSFTQALNIAETRVSAVDRRCACGLQQHAGNDSVGQPQVPLPCRGDGSVIVVGDCEAVVISILGAWRVGKVCIFGGRGLAETSCLEQLRAH